MIARHMFYVCEVHRDGITTGESSVIKVEDIPTICLRTITSPTTQTAILKPSIKMGHNCFKIQDLICPL